MVLTPGTLKGAICGAVAGGLGLQAPVRRSEVTEAGVHGAGPISGSWTLVSSLSPLKDSLLLIISQSDFSSASSHACFIPESSLYYCPAQGFFSFFLFLVSSSSGCV